MTGQLERIAEQTEKVMVGKGHAYALAFADTVVDVPLDHSHFMVTDCSIPFYQAVLHGSVEMVGPSMNMADDDRWSVLRSIEYGVGLQYQLIYQPSSFMKNTEYDGLYRSHYGDLLPEIAANARMVEEALDGVAGAAIVGHDQLEDQVFRTVYDNGTAVYVNYGDTQAQVDGIAVGARDFAVREAAENGE